MGWKGTEVTHQPPQLREQPGAGQDHGRAQPQSFLATTGTDTARPLLAGHIQKQGKKAATKLQREEREPPAAPRDTGWSHAVIFSSQLC